MNNNKKILLKSIRVIDPETNSDDISNVLISNDKIVSIDKRKILEFDLEGNIDSYNCKELIMAPGIIDMRIFLNGYDEEHINGLLKVASKSGILKLIATPNLVNFLDSPIKIEHLYEKSKNEFMPDILAFGAATKNLEGLQIPELGLMAESGAVGFSDGENCIQDALVMKRVMSYAKMFDKPILQHPEDKSLAGLSKSNYSSIRGEMNESEISTRLGLIGIPSCAEVMIIERDLRLAKLTKAHYHVSNVSTKEAVQVIKKGKEDGINITCDTSPPYFALNELELLNYNTSFKLSPPLRNEEDRKAIIYAIKNGVIDLITSNHQPMSNDTKLLPFSSSSIGACGLETLLPLCLDLVHQGILDLVSMLKLITSNPAKILKFKPPRLQINQDATFMVFNPCKSFIIDKNKLLTSPTPFHGRPAQGVNIASFIKGRQIYGSKEFDSLKNV